MSGSKNLREDPELDNMYLIFNNMSNLKAAGSMVEENSIVVQTSQQLGATLFWAEIGILRFLIFLNCFVNGDKYKVWQFSIYSISFLFPLTDYLPPQPWTHCQLGNNGKTIFLNQSKSRPMCHCILPSLTWCSPRCILRESRPHALASNPFFTAGNFIETFL